MKYIQLTIILLITITVFSCETKREKPLKSYYSKEEIQDIKKIVNFVIEEITSNCVGELSLCYEQYFEQFKNLEASDDIDLRIDKIKQKQILNAIPDNLKNDSWSSCQIRKNYKDKDGSNSFIDYQSLCVNTSGRIGKVIHDLQKKNKVLSSYSEILHELGGYSPSLNAGMIKRYYKFNFDSEMEMFVLAVHLITLNDEK